MIKYIPKSSELILKNFSYKGSCHSLLYKYAWSPFADFLIHFLPLNIAPNVITLIAFLIIIASHLIFMFLPGQFNAGNGKSVAYSDPIEKWKYVMFAVSLFLYQHLDNLDGKQARRTKNSTAVGMLFDHGADAITAMLVGFQIVKIIQFYNMQYIFYFAAPIIMIPNFLGIWTQYGTGYFTLQVINPIDEGLPLYQLLILCGAFYDYSFWTKPFLFGTYGSVFMVSMTVSSVITCIIMCKNVLAQTKRTKRDMLFKFSLIAILMGIFVLIEVCGLNHLIYEVYYFRFYYALTFFWTRNIIYMQICSVCNMEFKVLNRGTVSFLLCLFPMAFSTVKENLSTYLTLVLILQGILLLELIVSFLSQASDVLEIKLFSINVPKKQEEKISADEQKGQKKLQ